MFIECFVAAVPTDKRDVYIEKAEAMADGIMAQGALGVTEAWGVDVPDGTLTSYPMAVKCEPGETVVTGWIQWPSKEARDKGWEALMADPAMGPVMQGMPFDGKRMIFGGFDRIVSR